MKLALLPRRGRSAGRVRQNFQRRAMRALDGKHSTVQQPPVLLEKLAQALKGHNRLGQGGVDELLCATQCSRRIVQPLLQRQFGAGGKPRRDEKRGATV